SLRFGKGPAPAHAGTGKPPRPVPARQAEPSGFRKVITALAGWGIWGHFLVAEQGWGTRGAAGLLDWEAVVGGERAGRWLGSAGVVGHAFRAWPNPPASQAFAVKWLVPPRAGIWPDGQMCGQILPPDGFVPGVLCGAGVRGSFPAGGVGNESLAASPGGAGA